MSKYCISGVLIVEIFENRKLVGIIINCDMCFVIDYYMFIVDVMIKDNLVIVLVGIFLKDVEKIL